MTEPMEPAREDAPLADAEPALPTPDPGLARLGDLALPEEAPEPVAHPPSAPRSRRSAILVTAGIVAALVIGGIATFGGLAAAGKLKPDPTPVAAPTPIPAPTPTAAAIVADGDAVGAADAPVTVEIWADYQCPYCRLETFAYGPAIMREFVLPGRARMVYRDFAFLGKESVDAAVAARCAGQQAPAAYWRYHDILFVAQQGENQGTFSTENLVSLAKVAGLDQNAFRSCLADPAIAAAVTASTGEGKGLGIESTPTTRITGPGGTQVLKGFSPDWTSLADAIAVAEKPAPSPDASASPGGSAAPDASATPAGASASPDASATPAGAAGSTASPAASAGYSSTMSPAETPAP